MLSQISIHTPTKGVTDRTGTCRNRNHNFNPHSHEGSDHGSFIFSQHWKYFNPHSHEGSDVVLITSTLHFLHFNPHSHEGSDEMKYGDGRLQKISIHTPTKGVTEYDYDISWQCVISIHTPTKGVTMHGEQSMIQFRKFQSTLPRREWPLDCNLSVSLNNISIHTPTKVVTLFWAVLLSKYSKFQSTLPRRELLIWSHAYR